MYQRAHTSQWAPPLCVLPPTYKRDYPIWNTWNADHIPDIALRTRPDEQTGPDQLCTISHFYMKRIKKSEGDDGDFFGEGEAKRKKEKKTKKKKYEEYVLASSDVNCVSISCTILTIMDIV